MGRLINRGVAIAALTALVLPPLATARTNSSGDRAAQSAVTIAPEPTVLTLYGSETSHVGWLVVTTDGAEWSALTLRPQPLTLGANRAFVRFPAADNTEFVNLGDLRLGCRAGHSCRIEYEVYGVLAHGTYEGPLEVFSETGKVATTSISVLLPDAVFQPVLSSDSYRNDRLEVDVTDARSIPLTIASPTGSPSRTYSVTAELTKVDRPAPSWLSSNASTPTANTTIAFSPRSFHLDGGASQALVMTVPEELTIGSYLGALQITDANDSLLSKSVPLSIKRMDSISSRRATLLWWVVLGAFLSVGLNNIFPLGRARSKRLGSLRQLDDKRRSCAHIGPALRDALSSEMERLRMQIDAIAFFNASKAAILADTSQAIQDLSKVIDRACAISSLRSDADSAIQPIRTLLLVESHLCKAEDALARFTIPGADTGTADAELKAATEALKAEPARDQLAADLRENIQKLLNERKGVPRSGDNLVWRPGSISERIAQIERDLPNISAMQIPEMLDVERDFYIADVWTESVEFAIVNNPDKFNLTSLAALLASLQSNPISQQTRVYLSLLRSTLLPSDVEQALLAEQAAIRCDRNPRYFDLIGFEFALLTQGLAASPGARRCATYSWDFGDGLRAVDGDDRPKHFYLPPRTITRLWHAIRGHRSSRRNVSVTVRVPSVSGVEHTFATTLDLRRARGRASNLGVMQIAAFVLSTGVAVLAAFGTQYAAGLPSSVDWSVGISAFLFGFGIDQIRDRTVAE